MSVNEKMTAIADAIRDKTGGTETLTLDDMPTSISEVYDKGFSDGEQSEYDAFWDVYQDGGNRKRYYCAFAGNGWTAETFKPKHPIVPEIAYMIFGQGSEAIVNQSDCPVNIDFSYANNMQYAFYTNTVVKTLGTVDLSNANIIMGAFGNATNLKSIDNLVFSEKSGSSNANNLFQNCESLESVNVTGTIACSGLNFEACTLLTVESLRTILKALSKDSTIASGKSITFATEHQTTIESDSECSAYLAEATSAGWSVAYN